MNFYLVDEGWVEQVNPEEAEANFETSALVFAENEHDALRIAVRYDAGEIDFDNVWVPELNRAVAALCERD